MDLETAKNEFMKYVECFDVTKFHIKRKIDHSLRVMEICKKIAESLNLGNEEKEVATLIGLLHDIGRFEQFTKFGTFNDSKSVDHGKLGAKILSEENFIRKFIKEDKYDETIKISIQNHNKFEIEEGLDEKQLLFCKIIRDADKFDILYQCTYLSWQKEIEEIENTKLTKFDIEPFTENRLINRENDLIGLGSTKRFLIALGYVFDINFTITFNMLKETDYINKIINRFNFKEDETRQTIETVRNIVNNYIDNKQKG